MNKQPTYAFGGVFIPAHIWLNTQLTWLDKVIWSIVNYHHDGNGECKLTDADMADWLFENEMIVLASVTKMTCLGFIHSTKDADDHRILWTSGIRFVEKECHDKEELASTSDVQRIVDIYNECCKSLPRAEKLTPPRVARIRKLISAGETEEKFRFLFLRVQSSDFLSGRSGRWTACGIDWILSPANLTKIQEGVYDNRMAVPQTMIPANLR